MTSSMNGFMELTKYCYEDGEIDKKQKELIAIGCSIATKCTPCLSSHISNAISAGATKGEILEAAAIGIESGGGTAFALARDNLQSIIDKLL
jgi:AhpD family alkylhydroperoxidase